MLMLESHAKTRVLNDFTDLVLVTLLLNLEPMFRENNIHNSLILSLCAIKKKRDVCVSRYVREHNDGGGGGMAIGSILTKFSIVVHTLSSVIHVSIVYLYMHVSLIRGLLGVICLLYIINCLLL